MSFPPSKFCGLDFSGEKGYGVATEYSYKGPSCVSDLTVTRYGDECLFGCLDNTRMQKRILKGAIDVLEQEIDDGFLKMIFVPKQTDYKVAHVYRQYSKLRDITFSFRSIEEPIKVNLDLDEIKALLEGFVNNDW
jgi:hypothetical protein